MHPCLRLALLTATTLAGLATVPTRGADAQLERPRPLVPMTAADRWRLRPTQPVAVVSAGALPHLRAAGPIPDERRSVRQVYPALVEVR